MDVTYNQILLLEILPLFMIHFCLGLTFKILKIFNQYLLVI